jgi:hypothetical protein
MLRFLTGLILLGCTGGALGDGFPPAFPVHMPAASVAALPPPGARSGPAALTGAITSIGIDSAGADAQSGVPVTVGQVFAAGDVPRGAGLAGKLDDGTSVALQVDAKARHADGSLRHALISFVLPALKPGQRRRLSLFKAAPAASAAALTPAILLDKGFSADVSVVVDGQTYQASADALLRQDKAALWLAGPLATEWLVSAPLTDADGKPHPHLAARFALRAAGERARVDVTLENDWAFEPAPRNFTYDVRVRVGGKTVWQRAGLTHYHHARWRQVFWWGPAPQLQVRHDSAYLIASRAVPNYDQSVVVSEAALAALQRAWSGPKTEPMGVGLANPYMPTTGGRPDIGLLPGWSASYLLSMDGRAKQAMLGTADLAGSWSSHYRDRATGRPVSLAEHPYMTVLGHPGDTRNPATGKLEAFPVCAASDACRTPNQHDAAHQPAFAYLPYLVTGDYYYLEELQFWTMWNSFSSNPGYRGAGQGLFQSDQVRGQAWSLRTLAEAAWITPDNDPLNPVLRQQLDANLAWYNANYSAQKNRLGALTHGGALVYDKKTGLAPWMDDFFTSAVGHVAELGFADAKPLLEWKVTFPIARILGPGACWITGAQYSLKVRDSANAPIYDSMAQVWQASNTQAVRETACASPDMARALKLQVGEMTGYARNSTGFPANMQPALAYAAHAGGKAGAEAWKVFSARPFKPDYTDSPQFAIIPRP